MMSPRERLQLTELTVNSVTNSIETPTQVTEPKVDWWLEFDLSEPVETKTRDKRANLNK